MTALLTSRFRQPTKRRKLPARIMGLSHVVVFDRQTPSSLASTDGEILVCQHLRDQQWWINAISTHGSPHPPLPSRDIPLPRRFESHMPHGNPLVSYCTEQRMRLRYQIVKPTSQDATGEALENTTRRVQKAHEAANGIENLAHPAPYRDPRVWFCHWRGQRLMLACLDLTWPRSTTRRSAWKRPRSEDARK